MNPKSGKAASADAPDVPAEAEDAVVADPGEQGKIDAAKKKEEQAKNDSSDDEETHWIGIELKDEEGNPVPHEEFRVKLPDGKIIPGWLDDEGKAKVEGIPKGGQVEVSFPRIHKDEATPE